MADPKVDKLAIWSNRLSKEFDGLSEKLLPLGITQILYNMDTQEGYCRAQFRISIEEDPDLQTEGTTGTIQEVIVEIDLNLARTRYPFEPPIVKILRGAENIPPSNLKRDNIITLKELETWTPKEGIFEILVALRDLIALGGDLPDDDLLLAAGQDEGGMTDSFVADQAIDLDLFKGTIFACRVKGGGSRGAAGLIGGGGGRGGVAVNRYLGVSDHWVLEVKAHKTRVNWVVVVRAQELLQIQKLKFKRGLSITLIFKDERIWDLEMEDSGDCVAAIQEQLQNQGVQGKKTRQAALNTMDRARNMIREVKAKERMLHTRPTLDHVKEIVEMYREAIEKYASVSDEREQTAEVVNRLHAFLERPDVQAILDGRPLPSPPSSSSSQSSKGGGEGAAAAVGGGGGGGKPSPLTLLNLPALPRKLSNILRKGEIIQRSEADVLSEEDDGLAREEKNLAGFGITQLKKMMDLALDNGELRTPHTPVPPEEAGGGGLPTLLHSESGLSSSSISLLSPTTSGGPRPSSTNVDRALQDFQGLLGDAEKEFAAISKPEKPLSSLKTVGEEHEGERGEGGDSSAAAAAVGGGELGKEEGVATTGKRRSVQHIEPIRQQSAGDDDEEVFI